MDSGRIRPPTPGDRGEWDRLYEGYAQFYRAPQTPQMRDQVWAWIMDPSHELEARLAVSPQGQLLGLAHVRRFCRPLSASRGLFLDDLFVDPAARGQGVVDALLAELRRLARAEGLSVVRWITADDNYRGRGAYDRVARRTGWITYDMDPGADPAG